MKIVYLIIMIFVFNGCIFNNFYTKQSNKKLPFFHHWFATAPKVDTLCWSSGGANVKIEQSNNRQLLSTNQLDSILAVLKETEVIEYTWESIKESEESEAVYANYRIALSEVTTAYILSIHSASLHYPIYGILYNHEQGQVKKSYLLADYKLPSESGVYDCYSCWTGLQSKLINWLISYKYSYSQHQTLQFDNKTDYRSFVYFDSVKLNWYEYQKEDFQPVVTYEKKLLSRDEPTKTGQDTLVNYLRTNFYYRPNNFKDSVQAFNALEKVFKGQRQWVFY